MPRYFQHQQLMKLPPIKRAAYSDRTAWLMAELSRLVYERLPNEQELEQVLERFMRGVKGEMDRKELLATLRELLASTNETAESPTPAILKKQHYDLFNSYSIGGTEAMLVRIPPNEEARFPGMAVLVFRGTEPTSIADLRSDIRANLVAAPGGRGRIHVGFLEAFQRVEAHLAQDIEKIGDYPLYITGHSLGGALALVATKYLGSDSVGATYTFGGPRVADDAFFEDIKTPVYRVVNGADGVARIPFGEGLSFFLSILRVIPINGTLRLSEFIRRHLRGYTHYGNLTMLTTPPDAKDVTVLKSPSIFRTAKVVCPRMIATWGKAALDDHDMANYCEKLGHYALKRQ